MNLFVRSTQTVAMLTLAFAFSTSAFGQRTSPAPPTEPMPSTSRAVDTQFDVMDRNKDGVLTRDEIDPDLRLHREFDLFDANDTGTISLQEFREYVRVIREEQKR